MTTDPKSLSTIELVCEIALADAQSLTDEQEERYCAARDELAERFARSWIATGEYRRDVPSSLPIMDGGDKHHITFDFPTPWPLVREP